MRYYEPIDPEHPARRERPGDIANLYVFEAEMPDLEAMCEAHGPTVMVGVKKLSLIPAYEIAMLCRDTQAARALSTAWWDYCEMSPHRPHGKEECLAWGEQFNPFPNLPRDWTF
jgi:hypothetical protein